MRRTIANALETEYKCIGVVSQDAAHEKKLTTIEKEDVVIQKLE